MHLMRIDFGSAFRDEKRRPSPRDEDTAASDNRNALEIVCQPFGTSMNRNFFPETMPVTAS